MFRGKFFLLSLYTCWCITSCQCWYITYHKSFKLDYYFHTWYTTNCKCPSHFCCLHFTVGFAHGTPTYTSGIMSQIGADTIVSSGLICQLNLRPHAIMATQGTSPAVISSHPFQLKFLTAAIKVCAGYRGGYERGSDGKSAPPHKIFVLFEKNSICTTMLSMGGSNTQVCPMYITMLTPIVVLTFGALILILVWLKYRIL